MTLLPKSRTELNADIDELYDTIDDLRRQLRDAHDAHAPAIWRVYICEPDNLMRVARMERIEVHPGGLILYVV